MPWAPARSLVRGSGMSDHSAQTNIRTPQSEAGTSHRAASRASLAWVWWARLSPFRGWGISGKGQHYGPHYKGTNSLAVPFPLSFHSFPLSAIYFWMISLAPPLDIKRITKNHPPSSPKRQRGRMLRKLAGQSCCTVTEECKLGYRISSGHNSTNAHGRWASFWGALHPTLSSRLMELDHNQDWLLTQTEDAADQICR